jgi:hypothetical protein
MLNCSKLSYMLNWWKKVPFTILYVQQSTNKNIIFKFETCQYPNLFHSTWLLLSITDLQNLNCDTFLSIEQLATPLIILNLCLNSRHLSIIKIIKSPPLLAQVRHQAKNKVLIHGSGNPITNYLRATHFTLGSDPPE